MANENSAKRYYWLKLNKNFFDDARVRKLSRMPNGFSCVTIYLKLLLSCIDCGGELCYEGLEDTFAKEMALKLLTEEDETAATIDFLVKYGVLTKDEKTQNHRFLNIDDYIGSETESAERKRNYRQNVEKINCENGTLSHVCPTFVPNLSENVPQLSPKCPTEKEIEKEIEKEPELEGESKKEKEKECEKKREKKSDNAQAPDREIKSGSRSNSFNSLAALGEHKCSSRPPQKGKESEESGNGTGVGCGSGTSSVKGFAKPTVAEVEKYVGESQLNVSARAFWDFYESKGWKVGSSSMEDWKAALRMWARRENQSSWRSAADKNEPPKAHYDTQKYYRGE